MTTEFNLSNKIEWAWQKDKKSSFNALDIDEVKEFIRLLKKHRYTLDRGYPEDAGGSMVEDEEGEYIKIEDLNQLTGEELNGTN